MKRRRTGPRKRDRLAWWRAARFGMFIHWGIYSIPAGIWRGKKIPGIGEQIQRFAQIPVRDYEPLAQRFNPTGFDARAWVDLAKAAGMKYLVITAKHHDGFAMFRSEADRFNIVSATPFGRDIVKDLARECRRARIRLCLYYSHRQDWHDPDGGWNQWPGQYDGTGKTVFERYMHKKALPQVRELLTQYGPVGLIWYDTPCDMTPRQSRTFADLVHRLQPDCLVCGRVGNGMGDYEVLGDNAIPIGRKRGHWESPATINHTWGYKSNDRQWKSSKTLIHLLADLASKGVNYLLNVGPTAKGIIPNPSVRRLKEIGAWLRVHGEAIYGTEASPFPDGFEWGGMTRREKTLYLLIARWRRKLVIRGLRTRVREARLLSAGDSLLDFRQNREKALDLDCLEIDLPRRAPDPHCSVVALHLSGAAEVDDLPIQSPGGEIVLGPNRANIHRFRLDNRTTINDRGLTWDWFDDRTSFSWQVKIAEPGEFRASVMAAQWRHEAWVGGHTVELQIGDQKLSCVLTNKHASDAPRAKYDPEFRNVLGSVRIDRPGICDVRLSAGKINSKAAHGLLVGSVELLPQRRTDP